MNLLTILIIKELAQFGINLSRIKEATESLNRGLLNHPGWWDPHGEGSLLPKNPQPGDVIIPQDPAKLRYYLVGYDLHTDRGLFGYVIINEDEPLPLYMRERIMARHNTAVVVDVTSALEKVKKLL
jgi:hypothetical protein